MYLMGSKKLTGSQLSLPHGNVPSGRPRTFLTWNNLSVLVPPSGECVCSVHISPNFFGLVIISCHYMIVVLRITEERRRQTCVQPVLLLTLGLPAVLHACLVLLAQNLLSRKQRFVCGGNTVRLTYLT